MMMMVVTDRSGDVADADVVDVGRSEDPDSRLERVLAAVLDGNGQLQLILAAQRVHLDTDTPTRCTSAHLHTSSTSPFETDRQTDTLIAMRRSSSGGVVFTTAEAA